jgi:hypothetical protein
MSWYEPLGVDSESTEWMARYLPTVITTLAHAPDGEMEADPFWQAGYYFGNAVFRACAMAEKLSKVMYRDGKRVFHESRVLAIITRTSPNSSCPARLNTSGPPRARSDATALGSSSKRRSRPSLG